MALSPSIVTLLAMLFWIDRTVDVVWVAESESKVRIVVTGAEELVGSVVPDADRMLLHDSVVEEVLVKAEVAKVCVGRV